MAIQFTIKPLLMRPKTPFRISRKTQTAVKNILLKIESEGVTAFGESAPDKFYNENFTRVLLELRPYLFSLKHREPPRVPEAVKWAWEDASHILKSRAALSALDMAWWDFIGKMHRKPVWRLAGGGPKKTFLSSCTVGLGSIEEMVAKVKKMKKYPVVKVKLGGPQDLDILRALRAEYGGIFRVDANCAWDEDKTVRLSRKMKRLGVEFIEQPLPPGRLDAMAAVKKQSALPLIADENCVTEGDVEKCARGFHGVNIKLVKCGGLTPALRMVETARRLKLKVMVGCMLESNVGICAGAVIGARADYADLDGSWLLKDDPFSGHRLVKGRMTLNDLPGLGAGLRQRP